MIINKPVCFCTFVFMTLLCKEALFASNWTAPRENAPTLKMGIVGSSFLWTSKILMANQNHLSNSVPIRWDALPLEWST